jgi:hypothetical protein
MQPSLVPPNHHDGMGRDASLPSPCSFPSFQFLSPVEAPRDQGGRQGVNAEGGRGAVGGRGGGGVLTAGRGSNGAGLDREDGETDAAEDELSRSSSCSRFPYCDSSQSSNAAKLVRQREGGRGGGRGGGREEDAHEGNTHLPDASSSLHLLLYVSLSGGSWCSIHSNRC